MTYSEEYLTPEETARLLNISAGELKAMRSTELKLRFLYYGRNMVYLGHDVYDYISTSNIMKENVLNRTKKPKYDNSASSKNKLNEQLESQSIDSLSALEGKQAKHQYQDNIPSLYSKGKAKPINTREISHYLKFKHVSDNIKTALTAYNLEIRFNRHVTIHLKKILLIKGNSSNLITAFFKEMNRWLRRRNIEPYYIWTLENGEIKGVHLHLIIYIPTGKAYKAWKKHLSVWLGASSSEVDYKQKEITYPPVGSKSPLIGILQYIHKGIDELNVMQINNDFNLNIEPEYQGLIIGKRTGISPTLRRQIKIA